MEGSATGNAQEVPQMGAESKMEFEEPKVGERFVDYFTKEFDALGLSDAQWTDLGKWQLSKNGKEELIEKQSTLAPYYRQAIIDRL